MYAKILYDNKAKRGLLSGKGFSCLIDGRILFDAGGDPNSLLENMDRLMVSIPDLEAIVISHEHWEHTGGLWEILKRNRGLKVYVCPSFTDTFAKCVKELGGRLLHPEHPLAITENIFVTGPLKGTHREVSIYEQALVIKGEKGVSVITGCAHPGIIEVLKCIRTEMKIDKFYMVLGGFHLMEYEREEITGVISELRNLGVKKVGPTHCTGEKAIRMFSGKYHGDFIPVKAGHIIQL